MINITDKSQCCGCTACASICTHKAITMEPDAMGFLYPKVDNSKCVECELCEKVCAFNEHYDKYLNLETGPVAYAVRHKDMHQIETSRSGAAFIAFSDWIIEHGGVVYGVGYKDHFRVAHKRVTTKEQRDEFKGSKYVQSDLSNIFLQVKSDLKKGLVVLFSGTPCQTSGLNSYIGRNLRKNLILVDIICHGVPSPYIWRDYVYYIEKKYKSEVVKVNFRDKTILGWSSHVESFLLKDKKYISSNIYTDLFYKHIMFRDSCGSCHFTNIVRPSDITLADFWGWEKSVPNFNKDNKGCSLVFCNTQKGIDLFNKISASVNYYSVKLKDCSQPNLKKPSDISPMRNVFEKDYIDKGFVYVLKKYGNISLRYKIHRMYKRIITKIK